MPAPQASLFKTTAKTFFMANGIKLPMNFQQPSGTKGQQYNDAFKPGEAATAPGVPPMFVPASLVKYHTDTQKKIGQDFADYIDGISDAICSAWSQWQSAATLVGVVVNAVTAMGGNVVGPPMGPLILASAPKGKPNYMKYNSAIANTIGTAWLSYTSTIKVTGMPWYPAFAAVPSPVAPPMPNVPCPVIALMQVKASLAPATMKNQMVGMLGDPEAPHHKELFGCICDAFDAMFTIWQASTMVTNVLGTGPVPTFAPPYVPVGPVVGGTANMTPGGFV